MKNNVPNSNFVFLISSRIQEYCTWSEISVKWKNIYFNGCNYRQVFKDIFDVCDSWQIGFLVAVKFPTLVLWLWTLSLAYSWILLSTYRLQLSVVSVIWIHLLLCSLYYCLWRMTMKLHDFSYFLNKPKSYQ